MNGGNSMEQFRNNVKTCIQIPQYANLTVYSDGYHLTVTFPIKEDMIPFIRFKESGIWKSEVFYWKKKHYISAKLDMPFSKIFACGCPLDECVWHYASQMCNHLKIAAREAKIRALQAEVTQLTLF